MIAIIEIRSNTTAFRTYAKDEETARGMVYRLRQAEPTKIFNARREDGTLILPSRTR